MADKTEKDFQSIFDETLEEILEGSDLSKDEAKAKLSGAFLDAIANKKIMARLISSSMGELFKKSGECGVNPVEAVTSLFMEVAEVTAITLIKISSKDNNIEKARETFESMANAGFANGVNQLPKVEKMAEEAKRKETAEAKA